ncbi:MAG: DUF4114 domain-containing protein [Candidatus Eisenbacteria bacterium]
MKVSSFSCAVSALVLCGLLASSARAAVPVIFGTSWDPPSQTLQKIADARYGVGAINVSGDFLGARPGDPDPWFWIDNRLSALLVREVAGNANTNLVGWYEENGAAPVIDGVGDGVIFSGPAGDGSIAMVTFDRPMTRFGFYLNPNGPLDAVWAPEPEKFFTNRFYNDRGPNGIPAHAPVDGDVQAIVFDVSQFTQPNTWLVCFEDLDAGSNPAPCCYPTDNDYNDVVFEVTAFGATPTVPMTIGALKVMYLK